MLENISVMRVAGLMARHATTRQSIISQNIANADTPDYKARDIANFSESMSENKLGSEARKTRDGHMSSTLLNEVSRSTTNSESESNPNGNTVSIENEMLKSIEVEREHSQALAIYQYSVDLLKTSIGRGR